MYLKSLYLHGFKSFADKTTFEFDKGVTGIVGPNGCGKSNVVDAIRWVLGETSAKALRGGEMADVIFNGTDKRKPLGMAEVTLTLADCEKTLKIDHHEVAITRRVYRDGKSEYRINGTLCRLRDIGELFMDTGIGRSSYSIMEQGKIDLLLSSKPEDRRSVFEEAAGITKSKKEKKEALRKLEYTEANLLRVSDVMEEQERRINALKRQVAKARRYQSLYHDVRILDTHFGHHHFTELRAARAEFTTSMFSLEKSQHVLETELPAHEDRVTRSREKVQEMEVELTRLRQELSDKKNAVGAARHRMAFNDERKGELEERVQRNEEEIKQTHERLSEQEVTLEQCQAALSELERRILARQEEMSAREQKARAAQNDRAEVEKKVRISRTEANATQNLIATAQARIESALSQLEGSREREKQLGDEEKRLADYLAEAISEKEGIEKVLADHLKKRPALEEVLQKVERDFQHARGDLDASRVALAESHRELTRRASRQEVLQQLALSGEGLQKGTQAVLKGLNDPDLIKMGLRGVLGTHLKVPDDYARAIESVLENYLQAVVVRDAALADEIIERLTTGKKGAAALLPETFLPIAQGTQRETLPEKALAWALDVVEVEAKFQGLMERLLDKALCVPTRAVALGLRVDYPDLTFVTLEGEILRSEGFLSGGSGGKDGDSVLRRRNEIDGLKKEVADLEAAENKAKAKLEKLEIRLNELREEVEKSKNRVQAHKVEESTLNGQFLLAKREVDSLESKKKNVAWERAELAGREKKAGENRVGLEEDLAMARGGLERLEKESRDLHTQLDEAQAREREAANLQNEARTELAVEKQARYSASQQQKPMASRILELRELNKRREGEMVTARERIAQGATENESLAGEIDSLEEEAGLAKVTIEDLENERVRWQGTIKEAEADFSEARNRLGKITAQLGREEVEATKLDLRLENLGSSVLERHQVDLPTFRPDAHALLRCIAEQKKNAGKMRLDVDFEEESETSEEGDFSNEGEPDWVYVEAVVTELKRRLDSMGPVNVDAIQEFEELEERHVFTREQHDDLVDSKGKLLEIIERINKESERLFAETFAAVSKNFTKMFKELFGPTAEASLHLSDESDPLECGIEVVARPPGKRLQSITLMSGGERSMTAVALLFSIYMVKPSPFCVLDELDAPLDESNIGRFLKVLDAFINQSQFIIVTHSKRTMQRADVMYGVTMEEFGVSKPVGMRMSSEETKAEARTPAQRAAAKLDA